MITPTKIKNHLKLYLSWFTDLFYNNITASGASVDASNVVTVIATGHGRTTGEKLFVSGGTVRNLIASAVLNDNIVTFTTNYEHDLTAPQQYNDEKYLNLGGFGSVWDGQHEIAGISNRYKFDVELPIGETVAPTITGSEYLIEDRNPGLKGLHEITVIDTDTFTYTLLDMASMPVGIIDNISIISGFRISAAVDLERAQAIYTKQNMNVQWLFVIMNEVSASKDRNTATDAIGDFTKQDLNLLTLLQNFSIAVFIPTHNELSGHVAQDLAYGDLFIYLVNVLYGFGFEDVDSLIQYVTVSNGHGPGIYNSSYYIHVYDWQQAVATSYENCMLRDIDSVAFRNIESTWNVNADEMAQMELNINLDEEP